MVPPSSQMRHPEADPAIAAGRIIDWQSAQYYSALAEREKVPLLQARLDHVIRPRTEHPCAFGIGAVPLGDGSSAVTLRLQVGTSQFYWLAHPDDPELWQLLETWAAAGRCAFMLSGKRSWTLALDYGAIDKELKLLRRRSGTFDAGQFADTTTIGVIESATRSAGVNGHQWSSMWSAASRKSRRATRSKSRGDFFGVFGIEA